MSNDALELQCDSFTNEDMLMSRQEPIAVTNEIRRLMVPRELWANSPELGRGIKV